jgi:TRAP-type mannitol/chloroaromatic compound transport system substrate-binding protein
VEMGHSAALFWQGKMPASPLFTTAPFGLSPLAHLGWIETGGQALWDALYAPFSVKPFLAGNTGPSAAGWFRQPVRELADIKGLRIRVTGLGAEVYRRMGAAPMAVPPGDTYITLERGTIDAAEFLAPANDLPLGLHKVAPHLGYPGFNKPNGASEALIGAKAWHDLPEHLKAIVRAACRAEHDRGLADAEAANGGALRQALAEGAQPFAMPPDVLAEARRATEDVLGEIAARDTLSRRIVESLAAAKAENAPWRGMQGLWR